jgi:hypothetical protein
MEKRGDITNRTPSEEPSKTKTASDKGKPRQPQSSNEANRMQDHTTTRLSDAVTKETKKDS